MPPPEPEHTWPAIGAVLAGRRGSRIGGSKAMVELAGRPLIRYPLSAVQEAGLAPIVIAKRDSELPRLEVPGDRRGGSLRGGRRSSADAIREARDPLV